MEDVNISLVVKGKQDEIHIDDNITIVNYPTKIQENNNPNSSIALPKIFSETRIPLQLA